MQIDIFTLFPEMFQGPFGSSIIKRAIEGGIVKIDIHNIRDFTHDRHHTVDDAPYGGGAGMVMKPEPFFEAVESVKPDVSAPNPPVVLLDPQGRLFSQEIAGELAGFEHLVLVCGHYEGIDERVRQHLATDEISIGDYVLSGGELPAMVVVDALVRLLPGALGSELSLDSESHTQSLLEYPQYTRPPEFRGWKVPEVLLSGNHAVIAQWRREQSIKRTLERRPDLIEKADLTPKERGLVEKMKTGTASHLYN